MSCDLRADFPAAVSHCPQALLAVTEVPVTFADSKVPPLKLLRGEEFHVAYLILYRIRSRLSSLRKWERKEDTQSA